MFKTIKFPQVVPLLIPLGSSILLSLVVLFLSVYVATFTSPIQAVSCNIETGGITHGPRVGFVSDNAAKVWVRSCETISVQVQYKKHTDDWSSAVESLASSTDSSQDNTAVVQIQGLNIDTDYDYRIKADGSLPATSLEGKFRTLPQQDTPSKFKFAFAPDFHLSQFEMTQPINTLMSRNPLFTIMNGDNFNLMQGYPNDDPTRFDSVEDYRDLYKTGLSKENLPQFFGNVPTVMTWDDHEILNDWDRGQEPPYPFARQAYEEYVNHTNPDNVSQDGVYYTFKAGQVGFFVLDSRTFRSLGESPDGPDKTMLGSAQKQALKNWLMTSSSRFKFVVSSVMWSDFSRHISYGESWPAFATERNEIFDFIKDNKIPGVVLISGDEHWGGVFKIQPWNIYEILPDPMSWLLPGTTSTDPQVLFKSVGKREFVQFEVDTQACPGNLTLKFINALDNTNLYTLNLTEVDLGGDIDGDGLVACQEQAAGTDPQVADTDLDGCKDGRELSTNAQQGGMRNPLNRWDFFDVPVGSTPRDKIITISDINAVKARYFTNDANGTAAINRNTDPFSLPPPTGYHPAFDRGPLIGPDPWDLGPPDGRIDISDILAVIKQYFHNCN